MAAQKKRVNIKDVPEREKPIKLEKLEPVEVSDVEFAFPADVRHLMPPREEIPEDFKFGTVRMSPWAELMQVMFFEGAKLDFLAPRAGFDKVKALRHIRAVLGSFQPKHEHKSETVAYLMSLWFEDLPENWREQARVRRDAVV